METPVWIYYFQAPSNLALVEWLLHQPELFRRKIPQTRKIKNNIKSASLLMILATTVSTSSLVKWREQLIPHHPPKVGFLLLTKFLGSWSQAWSSVFALKRCSRFGANSRPNPYHPMTCRVSYSVQQTQEDIPDSEKHIAPLAKTYLCQNLAKTVFGKDWSLSLIYSFCSKLGVLHPPPHWKTLLIQ